MLLGHGDPWNPNTDIYSMNEDIILDCEGNIVYKQDQVRIPISHIEEEYDGRIFISQRGLTSLARKIFHETIVSADQRIGTLDIYCVMTDVQVGLRFL